MDPEVRRRTYVESVISQSAMMRARRQPKRREVEVLSYFRGTVWIDTENRWEGSCNRCKATGRLWWVSRALICSKCCASDEMRIAKRVNAGTARLDGMD